MNSSTSGQNDSVRALVGYFLFVLAVACAAAIALPPTLELFDPLPGSVQLVIILVGLGASIAAGKAFGSMYQTRNRLLAGLSSVSVAILLAVALITCVYKNETEGSDSIWTDVGSLAMFAISFGITGISLVLQGKKTQDPQYI